MPNARQYTMPCATHSTIRMAVRSSTISIKGEGRTEVVPTRATQPGYAMLSMPSFKTASTGAHGSAAISGSAFDVIASKVIESTSKRSPRARLGLGGRAAIVISDTSEGQRAIARRYAASSNSIHLFPPGSQSFPSLALLVRLCKISSSPPPSTGVLQYIAQS